MVLFGWVYIQVTPYRDHADPRGQRRRRDRPFNGAVWVTMPVASVIARNDLLDMVVWSVVALLVQIAVYVAARVIMPGIVSTFPTTARRRRCCSR